MTGFIKDVSYFIKLELNYTDQYELRYIVNIHLSFNVHVITNSIQLLTRLLISVYVGPRFLASL